VTLRTYLEVANTGNYALLGNGTEEQRKKAWQDIIKESGKHSGDMHFDHHFDLVKNYGLLLADYTVIKSALSQLLLKPDQENVDYLRSRGYVIETVPIENYYVSIQNAITKSSNLISKLNSAFKDLTKGNEEEKDSAPANIGQLVASLNFALGGNYGTVGMLLSEYNEYKKIVKAKQRKSNGRD